MQATLLAPTDDGIAKTLAALGLTVDEVLADPLFITDVLEYHLLPSILSVGCLAASDTHTLRFSWHFMKRCPVLPDLRVDCLHVLAAVRGGSAWD